MPSIRRQANQHTDIEYLFDKQYRQHLDQDNSPGFTARFGMTMRLGG